MATTPRIRRRPRQLPSIAKTLFGFLLSFSGLVAKLFDFIRNGDYTFPWIFDKLLLIGYLALGIFATITAVQATRILYGRQQNQPKILLLLYVAVSVSTCIIGFALAYIDLSTSDPEHAFSIKKPLTPITALYFSIITFATVGYGDIYPTSELTQMVVSAQVLISICYTVLIFSVIAGFIQQRPAAEAAAAPPLSPIPPNTQIAPEPGEPPPPH